MAKHRNGLSCVGLALGLGACEPTFSEGACAPLIKFDNPLRVSPPVEDGVVTLTARAACTEDHEVWAWPEGESSAIALDVYATEESGVYTIQIPVDESQSMDGCSNAVVAVALVAEGGDLADVDYSMTPHPVLLSAVAPADTGGGAP